MEQALQLAVRVFAALATGGLVVNWIGLGRATSRLSASTYVEFHQATNRTVDPYMPIVVVSALLGGIVLAILSQGIHSLSRELAIAGSLCYVAVLAIASSTNVRINKQIEGWSVQSPPDDWQPIRARWVRFHIVRTLFSLPGLACDISLVLSVDDSFLVQEMSYENWFYRSWERNTHVRPSLDKRRSHHSCIQFERSGDTG